MPPFSRSAATATGCATGATAPHCAVDEAVDHRRDDHLVVVEDRPPARCYWSAWNSPVSSTTTGMPSISLGMRSRRPGVVVST